jgi:hypothetical protein
MASKPHLILMKVQGKTLDQQAEMAVDLYRRLTGKEPTPEMLKELRADVEMYKAKAAATTSA